MKRLHIYTDGSGTSRGNPGGYAYLIVDTETGNVLDTGSGQETDTTNNRMELSAAIAGLSAVDNLIYLYDTIETVVLKSDSLYVLHSAQRRTRPTANLDLIETLLRHVDLVAAETDLKFEHVRAHRGEPYNEMVDRVAGLRRSELLLRDKENE